MSEWEKWVHKVTEGASSREVGERIGHSHTTALRWMKDGASPEAVIALALAYQADPIQAMVAAGWLRADLVKDLNLDGALKSLSTLKLAAEVHRRVAEATANHGEHS